MLRGHAAAYGMNEKEEKNNNKFVEISARSVWN